MKDNFDANAGSARKREDLPRETAEGKPNGSPNRGFGRGPSNGHLRESLLDFWTISEVLIRRWRWLVVGGLIFGAGFFLLASYKIKPKFTANAQLLRYESPVWKDFFQNSTPMSGETFAGLIRSPELLGRVGTNISPRIAPEQLSKQIKVEPEADTDIIKILLAAPRPQEAVNLLNAYLREAVAFTREYQAQQAEALAQNFYKKEVEKIEEDWKVLEKQLLGSPLSSLLTNRLSEIGTNINALNGMQAGAVRSSAAVGILSERLHKQMTDLAELNTKYTEAHPLVQQMQAQIAATERQIASASTNPAAPGAMIGSLGGTFGQKGYDPQQDIIRTKLLSVGEGSVQLRTRLHQAQLIGSDPPGMANILSPASMKTVQTNWRSIKVGIGTSVGFVMGLAATFVVVMLVELTDRRLHTATDVQRVTGLPILGSLGDLKGMSPGKRERWAFRAWTMLQGRLSRSANHGLVCGITSSSEGEGRSTWIELLAQAASLAGFRVLTIATKPSPASFEEPDHNGDPYLLEAGAPVNHAQEGSSSALAPNVLALPAKVTEQLTGPTSQPVVHIPLPGWVWNLERRKQWREALNHWRRIDNLVILVELPPASVAEAVLLGSNLPNLVWLADSGSADAAETRAQLETLRDARCNLVGAVLNRESPSSVKKLFPRWLECLLVLAALSAIAARGQPGDSTGVSEPPPAISQDAAGNLPAESPAQSTNNVSFSIVQPEQRAAWQQHLTLGPGDVLTLGLYGQPEFTRAEVVVAPDGMINYLEATNVLATGLTIDELRVKLDEALREYRRGPHTMITPIAFRSKKYYMLGKVMTKGVYTLDRPLTVLEAVARAHGLEHGLVDRNIIDIADFQRSFLVRGGKRYAINFARLFQEGDLSQNIAVEPDDYIYFPASNAQEVYVVGEVRLPGTVSYTPETTIIAAISARGGYTDRAYKARVLVVRGSLSRPETYAVDTHAILDGKALDFKLRPRDIIYVNSRPFIRVEELTELAITAFIQSFTAEWVGVKVVKPIQ